MSRLYSGVVGAVLLLVGVAGFATNSLLGLEFHPAHNVIHLASGVLGLLAAGVAGGSHARLYALVFGAVYTAVAVAGFLAFHDLGSIHLGLGTPYNLIHLAIGVAGLTAGIPASSPAKPKANVARA